MPVLKKQFHLAPVQSSIAMAIPVLLGSLGRIPLGLLTDRLGGRKVFTGTMVASVLAAVLMGWVGDYSQLLLFGFFTGAREEQQRAKRSGVLLRGQTFGREEQQLPVALRDDLFERL